MSNQYRVLFNGLKLRGALWSPIIYRIHFRTVSGVNSYVKKTSYSSQQITAARNHLINFPIASKAVDLLIVIIGWSQIISTWLIRVSKNWITRWSSISLSDARNPVSPVRDLEYLSNYKVNCNISPWHNIPQCGVKITVSVLLKMHLTFLIPAWKLWGMWNYVVDWGVNKFLGGIISLKSLHSRGWKFLLLIYMHFSKYCLIIIKFLYRQMN